MSDLVLDADTGSYRHPGDPGEPSTGNPRLSVTDDEATLLAELVDGLDVLEIGTGLGVSTRALASSAKSVVTVDPDPWVQATVWPALPMNVAGFRQIPGRTMGDEWSTTFDAVFIDADHTTEAVRSDLAAAFAVVRPGGVVIAHDTAYRHVRDGLGDLDAWQFIDTVHGLGILRVPS